MIPVRTSLGLLALVISAACGARTISRSSPQGSVNLVEINVKGTIYGTCSFVQDGQTVEVMYEDTHGEIVAKASNPTVLDAISKTHQCREAATRAPESAPQSRSALEENEESPRDLVYRIESVQRNLMANQRYVSGLRPRFGSFSNSKNDQFLVTFGSDTTHDSKNPEVGFSVPHKDFSQGTVSFGLPFGSNNGFNGLSLFGRR